MIRIFWSHCDSVSVLLSICQTLRLLIPLPPPAYFACFVCFVRAGTVSLPRSKWRRPFHYRAASCAGGTALQVSFRYGAKKRESLLGWTSLEIPYIIYKVQGRKKNLNFITSRAEKGGYSLYLSQKRRKSTASLPRDQMFVTIFVQKVCNLLILFCCYLKAAKPCRIISDLTDKTKADWNGVW